MQYRAWYRQEKIPTFYQGVVHALFVLAVISVTVILCLGKLERFSLFEGLVFLTVFIAGNFIEYGLHRIPLHRPLPGLRWVYRIHTQEHHQFFQHTDPAFTNSRDLHTVFFPYYSVVLLVFGLAGVAFIAPPILLPQDSKYVFIASGTLYFLMYEVFHFLHHFPRSLTREDESSLSPWTWMRRHHCLHHDPTRMSRSNFNVTFPLADWVFRTIDLNPRPRRGSSRPKKKKD